MKASTDAVLTERSFYASSCCIRLNTELTCKVKKEKKKTISGLQAFSVTKSFVASFCLTHDALEIIFIGGNVLLFLCLRCNILFWYRPGNCNILRERISRILPFQEKGSYRPPRGQECRCRSLHRSRRGGVVDRESVCFTKGTSALSTSMCGGD